ncbi:MAG: FixH family protein [Pseudomonadota bacterium]
MSPTAMPQTATEAVEPNRGFFARLVFRLVGQDRWIPWLFVLGFLILFAVTGTFVKLALGTFPGLITTNAYERGLAYDEVIAAEQAQAARGWQMSLDLPRYSGEGQTVSVTLHDKNGEALSNGHVTLMAERMTRYAQQIHADLTYKGDGVYEGPIEFPISGRWFASVLADVDGERHFETQEIYLLAPGVD